MGCKQQGEWETENLDFQLEHPTAFPESLLDPATAVSREKVSEKVSEIERGGGESY